jgi:hypothetical protein
MAIETYALQEAAEQLQLLVERGTRIERRLRSPLNNAALLPLSAGVMQIASILVYYSLGARLAADDDRRVVFELEVTIDADAPDGLTVVCVIGRSRIERAVTSAATLTWTASLDDVWHSKAQRVEAVTISLHLPD